MSLETAIKKAIANEWKDEKIPENSQFSFRGTVQIELDCTVKRGEDTRVVARVDFGEICVGMLTVIAKRAKIEPHEVAEFLSVCRSESIKDYAKLVRYEDAINDYLEKVKDDIQATALKTAKAAPTQVRGVIRLGKITPKKG